MRRHDVLRAAGHRLVPGRRVEIRPDLLGIADGVDVGEPLEPGRPDDVLGARYRSPYHRRVPELVEREAEAAALAGLVRAAAAGDGGAVLIEGEAGIGKTSLLTVVRAHAAAAGLRVLSATADEIE